MAAGSIYQIKLTSTVLGKDVYNIFHYQQGSGGSIPGDQATTINNAFWASIDTELLAIMHPSNSVKSAELFELDFLSVWNLKTISAAGTWTDASEQGAAFRQNTVGLRYNRVAVGQRHGYKRFSGAAVEAAEDGVWGAAMVVLAGALADALDGGFDAGTVHFSPFIASRPIVLGVNPSGYVPSGVDFYQGSSQNTRK